MQEGQILSPGERTLSQIGQRGGKREERTVSRSSPKSAPLQEEMGGSPPGNFISTSQKQKYP
ncbi:hypothetical protein GCWU000341_00258 [Oribacterium sp. oral taxon 078 str. F0262]|nr:hypothetical protein GCWU000341_00258 [Oribacterium sp. oral taxon 078 str. F0262]